MPAPPATSRAVAGDGGTALAGLFHGYATFDHAEVGRGSKVLRPFRASTKTLLGAGADLVGRAWRREPAYPGLGELLGRAYRALAQQGPVPIQPAEYCIAAALNERLAPKQRPRRRRPGAGAPSNRAGPVITESGC